MVTLRMADLLIAVFAKTVVTCGICQRWRGNLQVGLNLFGYRVRVQATQDIEHMLQTDSARGRNTLQGQFYRDQDLGAEEVRYRFAQVDAFKLCDTQQSAT